MISHCDYAPLYTGRGQSGPSGPLPGRDGAVRHLPGSVSGGTAICRGGAGLVGPCRVKTGQEIGGVRGSSGIVGDWRGSAGVISVVWRHAPGYIGQISALHRGYTG